VSSLPSRQQLQSQVAELTARLGEAQEALAAIRDGEVDAIVVSGKQGEQIFSLAGTDSVYRLIVESMQEAALTATLQGRILFCNSQFSAMLRLPLEALIGRKLAELVAVEDHPLLDSLLRAATTKPVKEQLGFRGPTGTIPSHVSASFLPQQEEPCICIVVADLSELVASHEELRRSNGELQKSAAQLRRLAGELARTEWRERRRLASILHDGLQQLLVGAQLQMSRVIAESGKWLGPSSQRVAGLLNESIEIARSLALEISPPIRASAGLVVAFTWLARWMQAKHSLKVKVTIKGNVGPVGEDITVLLFSSVQELLLNVVKHAGVKTADLWLEEVRDHLRIGVSDKGLGFDVERVEQVPVNSFGLFSIHERLSLVGGRLDIRSEPGSGSKLTLVVPLASLHPDGKRSDAAARGPSRQRSAEARGQTSGTASARAGKQQR
jgi:PAS domain S-box-containing protein